MSRSRFFFSAGELTSPIRRPLSPHRATPLDPTVRRPVARDSDWRALVPAPVGGVGEHGGGFRADRFHRRGVAQDLRRTTSLQALQSRSRRKTGRTEAAVAQGRNQIGFTARTQSRTCSCTCPRELAAARFFRVPFPANAFPSCPTATRGLILFLPCSPPER